LVNVARVNGDSKLKLLGEGANQIARQAALLFALSGLSALAAIPTQPGHVGVLAVVAGGDVLTAVIAWLLPWHRWDRRFTAVLALPGFAVLGLSTWVFGGFAAGTGPFFVLLFAWLGLHQPIWILAACVPPATIAYVAPLVAVHAPPPVLSSAVVLIPIVFGVGALIAAQARHLRAERDRADRAERWRAAMTATLAHDLRQPLTAIQGALKLASSMRADLDPVRRQALLESAHAQTMRVTRLATSLLDVERIEQGKLRLDLRTVPVAAAVKDARALVSKTEDIRVFVDEDLQVRADPDRLEQILVNLTTNALRHGRPPVDISAHREDHTVRIDVRDHGTGVPERLEGRLFGRLEGDSDHPESVGLGMWIVRLLVEAHGGTISYQPANPGARFRVCLPASETSLTGE
jgi:signal transduction histidine kinase